MKVKTRELIGQALNWAVAKCEKEAGYNIREGHGGTLLVVDSNDFGAPAAFSTDWAQGGPIIERERIGVWTANGITWHGRDFVLLAVSDGQTPLVAAMRAYVSSELGDTVDIPEVL